MYGPFLWPFAVLVLTALQVHQGLHGNYKDILTTYWQHTINHLENDAHDYKIHQLPLARIKKVMKADPEVKMISAEAPILFAKGCDIFITELTMRAWIHAEENKRRTLQRSDIASALTKSDMFDFLIDIVPREEASTHKRTSQNSSAQQQVPQAQPGQMPGQHPGGIPPQPHNPQHMGDYGLPGHIGDQADYRQTPAIYQPPVQQPPAPQGYPQPNAPIYPEMSDPSMYGYSTMTAQQVCNPQREALRPCAIHANLLA